MKKKIITIIIAAILLASCDTGYYLSGTVIDSLNNFPIDSARIYIGNPQNQDYIYTDSNGQFKIIGIKIGLHYKMKISLEKDGYKQLKKIFPNWNDNPVILKLSRE